MTQIQTAQELVLSKFRNIVDFPKKGIIFKDITTVIKDKEAFNAVISYFETLYKNKREGISLCKEIKSDIKLKNIKMILTSNLHNKEEILNAGADIYLPKPYDIITVYNWVEKYIKEYNY